MNDLLVKQITKTRTDVSPQVLERAAVILAEMNTPDKIVALGSIKANHVNDELLKNVKCKDLDDVGTKLNEVVSLAKNINVQDLVKRSKIPLIGTLIDRVSGTKQKLLGKYDSLSEQINKLMTEITVQQNKMSNRIKDLEKMYEINVSEYQELDAFIIAGEAKLLELQDDYANRALVKTEDSLYSQQLSDSKDVINRLEKRINDLKIMQVIAVQTAPMIRMIQSNNRELVDKFRNLQELTVPSWRKQFTLAIALIEQQKAVELTKKIDDTTNDLLRANANLLKTNSIETAKSMQRGIVDIDTLEYVQSTLISTVEEVNRIQQEGQSNRVSVEAKLMSFKTDLANKLTHK